MIVLKIIGWILLSILGLIVVVLCIRLHIQVEYSDEQTSVLLQWLFLKFNLYPTEKKESEEKVSSSKTQNIEQLPDAGPSSAEPETEQTSAKTETTPSETETVQPENETESEALHAAESDVSEQTVESQTQPKTEEKKKDSLLKTIYNAEGIDGLITIVKKIFSYSKTFFGNALRGIVVEKLYLEVCCTRSDAAATAIYYGEVCGILFPMLGSLASKCRLREYDFNIYPDFLARFSHVDLFVRFHLTPIYLIGITFAYGLKMLFGVLVKLLVKIFLPKKDKTKQETEIKK